MSLTDPPVDACTPSSEGAEDLKYELTTWKNALSVLMAEVEEIDRLLLGTFGKSREERIQTLLEWQRVGRAATGAAGLRDAADLEGWCRGRRAAMEQIPMFGGRECIAPPLDGLAAVQARSSQ